MQLNRPLGHALKREGMQAALDFSGEAWAQQVVDEFREWAAEQKALGFKTVTIESFRAQSTNPPASHKAWGSVPRLLCKAGLVAEHTDEAGNPIYTRAAAPRTHAHPVRVWRLVESAVSA
jgi:hypothetical protein